MTDMDKMASTVIDSDLESATEGGNCADLIPRDKGSIKGSRIKDIAGCLVKAFAVVVFLSCAKDCAPILSPWLLPIAFLIYALPATIGAMYGVVARRLHKQDLYNENGRLSHFNRRWIVWFGVLFVIYLASAALFVLQAPGWDGNEWLLIWVAPVVFYVVFLFMQFLFKKEYSVKYYKAWAIQWSAPIAALLLTIVYALIAAQSSGDIQMSLSEAIENRGLSYRESPAALLSELDKLTSYANCLTEYGIDKLRGASYTVSVIVSLMMSFSVFAGIVSLFSACLLDSKEVASEFRLLPAREGSIEPVQIRYIVLLVVLWAGLSGAFVWLNDAAEEIRASNEYTMIDQWVDNTSKLIMIAADENIDAVMQDHESAEAMRTFEDSFVQKWNTFVDEQLPVTCDQVNAYYDDCAAKIDAYMDWYGSPLATAVRIVPVFGEDMMRDEFAKQIVDSANSDEAESQYDRFLAGLKGLYNEYGESKEKTGDYRQAIWLDADSIMAAKKIPGDLSLWPARDSEEDKKFVQEVLLNKGGDENSPDAKERILDYIEQQRESTLAFLNGLPGKFFSQNG